MARTAGIPFAAIPAGKYRRIPGSSLVQKLSDVRSNALNLRDIGLTAAGIAASLRIMRRFRPDVIFAKGGFVSLPVAVAGNILGVPVVIHESDVTPGLGNKIVSRWAKIVAVGFPLSVYMGGPTPSVLPSGKLLFTGNPVRPEIVSIPKSEALAALNLNVKCPLLLVMGGSQGAKRVNDVLLNALPLLLKTTQIFHITGELEIKRVNQATTDQGIGESQGYHTAAFVDAHMMAQLLSGANLVISRAGANTIAELAALKKPTILIPNRLMAAHQLLNARRLKEAGAVKVVSEKDLTEQSLATTVINLLKDTKELKRLGDSLGTMYVPSSADKLAHVILSAGGDVA